MMSSSRSSDIDLPVQAHSVTSRLNWRMSLHPDVLAAGRKRSVMIPSTPGDEHSTPSTRAAAFERRRSSLGGRFNKSVYALLNMRRTSHFLKTPPDEAKLENTYKLGPDDSVDLSSLQAAVNDTLALQLQNETYDASTTQQLCIKLSNLIKIRAKRIVPERYRVIVVVNVGLRQLAGDVIFASRCLWNSSTDNFVSGTYQNESLYAVANVYAVYLD